MNSLNYENKNLRVKENLTLKNNKQNNRYSSPDILSDEKDYHDNSNTNCFICSYPIHKKEEKYFLKKDSTSGVLQLDIIKKKLKEKGELKYIDKKDRKEDNSNKDCTNKDSINKDNRNKNYRNKDKIKNYEDGYYDEEKIKEQNEPEKWECITKNGNEECFLNKKHIRNKKENTDENIENKNRYFDMEKEKISNDIRLHHNKKREIEENKNSLTYTHSSNTFANNLNLSNDLSKINKSEQTYNEFCYSKAYEKENSHINTRKRDDSCDKEDTFVGLMKYYNTEQKKNENNNKDEETKLINDQISEEKKKTKIINYIKNMFLLENKNSLINLESHAHKDMEEHSSKNSNSICTNSIKDNRIKELHTSENEQKINEENYKGEISYNKTWNSNKKNIENFESTKIPHKDNSENVEYNFLKKKTENEMNLNINNPHNNISLLKDNKEKENLLEKKSDCFNENKKDLNEKKNKTNIKINSNILKKILKMKIESMKNNVNNRKMYKEQKMELTSFNDKELSKFPREVLFNDEGTELKDCEKNTIKEKNTVISSNNNIKHGFQVVETGGNQGHEENNFDNSFTPFHVINSSNRISSVDNFFDNNNNVNIYENKFKSSNELLLINDKMHGLNIINRKFNEDVVDAKYNNKNSDTIKNNSNNNNNINDNIKNDSNYNSDNNDFMINFDKKYNSKDCVGNNSDGNMSNSEDINDTIYNSNNKIEVLDFNKSYYCYLKKIKNNEVYPNSEEPITKDDKIKLMKAYLNNKKKKKNSEKYLLKYNIEFFKMAQFFCEDYNMYNNYLRNMAYNLSKYGDDVDKTAFSIVKLLGSKKNLNEKNSLKGRNENNDLSTSTEIKKDNNFLKYKKNPNITCDPFNCDSIEIVNTFNKKKKFIKNSILLARTKMNENLYSKKKGSATLSSITTDKNNLIKSKLDQSNNKINYFTQNQNKYSNKYLMNKKSSIFLNQKHIKDYFKEKNNTFSRSSSTKFANEIEPFNGSKNCYITKRSNSTKQRNSLLKTSALIEKYEKLKCK